MKKHLQRIAARAAGGLRALRMLAASWAPDAFMSAGAGAIAYGAWLVYEPAGFIVGGGFLLATGWLAARKGA